MSANKVRTKKDGKILLARRKGSKTNAKTTPILYNKTVASRICQKLIEGMSLNKICQLDKMPHIATVYGWLGTYPEFNEAYRQARVLQADTLGDKLLDVPDDYKDVQRGRLKSENTKWLISKTVPTKYGDKISVGSDSDVNISVTYEDKDKKSNEISDALPIKVKE